jgi:hypothetical protein
MPYKQTSALDKKKYQTLFTLLVPQVFFWQMQRPNSVHYCNSSGVFVGQLASISSNSVHIVVRLLRLIWCKQNS